MDDELHNKLRKRAEYMRNYWKRPHASKWKREYMNRPEVKERVREYQKQYRKIGTKPRELA